MQGACLHSWRCTEPGLGSCCAALHGLALPGGGRRSRQDARCRSVSCLDCSAVPGVFLRSSVLLTDLRSRYHVKSHRLVPCSTFDAEGCFLGSPTLFKAD